jgi:hypothetical protein
VAEFVLPTFVRDRVAVRLLVLSSAGVGWSGSAVCAVSCSVSVLYLIHMYVRITIIIHFVIFDFILLDRANCSLSLSLAIVACLCMIAQCNSKHSSSIVHRCCVQSFIYVDHSAVGLPQLSKLIYY